MDTSLFKIIFLKTGLWGCLFYLTPITCMAQLRPFQHLDATIASSVITSKNNIVAQWNDLSAAKHDALNYAGEIIYPSTSLSNTEKAGVGFLSGDKLLELFSPVTSDSLLDFTGAASKNTGFAFILAFKVDSLVDSWNDLLGNSSAAAQNLHFGLRFSADGLFQVYLGSALIQGGSVSAGETVVVGFNYNSSTGAVEFWNSNDEVIRSSAVKASDFSNSNSLFLGGMRWPTDGRYFNGMVGEVEVFKNALTTSELLTEGARMKLKWVIKDSEDVPPDPNPASFSINPKAVSYGVVYMKAAVGKDRHEPVEYLFNEVSGNSGGSNSKWQRYPYFRDGDLKPSTRYSYTVTTRDALGNEGKTSDTVNVVTTDYSEPGLENDLEYGVYYGYQGWHFAPNDGRVESNNWVHWFNNNQPDGEHIHGDMWPDLSEYDPENLYETDLKYRDGSTVKVYSSHDYSTIDLHVKWMKEYGIKGCVVQRFTEAIDKPYKLEQGDKKILDIMTACEKYGVKFWIMHDAGKGDSGEIERITNDWRHLVDDLDILQSTAYAFQNGKPVYGLWGMGVGSRGWIPAEVDSILDFYQEGDSVYQAYVVGGVTSNWYTNIKQEWMPVYQRLDMLSPWRTLFYNNAPYQQSEIDRMYAEKAWCDQRGIDYNPVITPGASAGNIGLATNSPNRVRNGFPRNGGKLLWKQAYEVCKMGSKFMYIAMFDEIDEGTAMYKMVETEDGLPVNARQVSLDEDGYDLPGDWYLKLGNEIQKMMDGTSPVEEEMPLTPKKLFELSPSPRDGAREVNNHPVLAWNSVPVAHNYKVYLRKGIQIFSDNDLITTQMDTSLLIANNLENNTTYYWRVDVLTQTQAFKGEVWNFTVANSTDINHNTTANLIIYPNPAKDEIRILGIQNQKTFRIINILGSIEIEGALYETNKIDISLLQKGFYTLLIDGSEPVKFIKR